MAHPQLRLVEDPAQETESVTARPLSLDDLFRTYASYVAAIGLRLLGRPEEVEDLVQDVFLDAQRERHKLQEREAAKRWLAVVAVRKARRRLQSHRLRSFVGLDSSTDYRALSAPGASPEDMTLLLEIYRVLDRLPVEQRLAWSLRHLQGEHLDDVADMCNCSLATAKRRIAAAHQVILKGTRHGRAG